jgi:ankyrin repeat protein
MIQLIQGLPSNADVNIDSNGTQNTPLIDAYSCNNYDRHITLSIVEDILEHGANPNSFAAEGLWPKPNLAAKCGVSGTALMEAVRSGSASLVQTLFDRDVEYDQVILPTIPPSGARRKKEQYCSRQSTVESGI